MAQSANPRAGLNLSPPLLSSGLSQGQIKYSGNFDVSAIAPSSIREAHRPEVRWRLPERSRAVAGKVTGGHSGDLVILLIAARQVVIWK